MSGFDSSNSLSRLESAQSVKVDFIMDVLSEKSSADSVDAVS